MAPLLVNEQKSCVHIPIQDNKRYTQSLHKCFNSVDLSGWSSQLYVIRIPNSYHTVQEQPVEILRLPLSFK